MLFALISVVLMCKVHSKMGLPWWSAIVPFYNTYVIFDKMGIPLIFFILFFIPFANFVSLGAMFVAIYRLVRCMGYGIGMFLLFFFLTPLALAILAFGSCTYRPLYENRAAY